MHAPFPRRGARGAQVEKEVGKARGVMAEVDAELGRKKAASRGVKALRAAIGAAEAEAAALGARQQHLERQRASLAERLQRLEHQARGGARRPAPRSPAHGPNGAAVARARQFMLAGRAKCLGRQARRAACPRSQLTAWAPRWHARLPIPPCSAWGARCCGRSAPGAATCMSVAGNDEACH